MMNGFEDTGMDAVLAGSFRAAIYCRLSKDDDLDGESASIANQRDMLETYCEKQGWEVVAIYQDDGYTGLNMERPDLKRMLKRYGKSIIGGDLSENFVARSLACGCYHGRSRSRPHCSGDTQQRQQKIH